MAMLNDDVNQIERFLNIGFNEILQLLVLFIFAGSVMFGVSWELAIVGLLPLPIVLWGSLLYQRLISPRYRKVREAVGALSSRLENNIAGIMVIKSFTAENLNPGAWLMLHNNISRQTTRRSSSVRFMCRLFEWRLQLVLAVYFYWGVTGCWKTKGC